MDNIQDRSVVWASRLAILAQELMAADGEEKAVIAQEWADLCGTLVKEEKRFPGLLEAVEEAMNNKGLTLYC